MQYNHAIKTMTSRAFPQTQEKATDLPVGASARGQQPVHTGDAGQVKRPRAQ